MPELDELEAFTMVLLRRPKDAPEMSEQELDELQARHLAYWDSLYERGLLVHGPVTGQPDQSIRGFALWRLPVDEVQRLVDLDPSAQAGRLEMEVFTWHTVPGRIELRGP
jgi:uncharacterized protein